VKIACVISSLRLGGAERQLIGLAETLRKLGHTAEIVTYHKENFYSDAVSSKGLHHRVITARHNPGIIAKLAALDADVVISYLAGTNLKVCLSKLLNPKLKLIVSERNCNRNYRIHDWFRFVIYNRFADIVLCNNYSQEEFIRNKFPKLSDKLVTVPNFVDLETFFPASGRHCKTNHIVVTARVCRRKNTLGLIRAASILRHRGTPDFRVDWYGLQKETRYEKKCRKMIARRHLEECFFLHPATADVASKYREADFFCLPSFYEGTSNALAEALASGLPVACSFVSDNVRYVSEGENGWLFNPFLPRNMADGIGKLIFLDSEERRAFGANSRSKVEQELSREAFERKIVSLLSKIQ